MPNNTRRAGRKLRERLLRKLALQKQQNQSEEYAPGKPRITSDVTKPRFLDTEYALHLARNKFLWRFSSKKEEQDKYSRFANDLIASYNNSNKETSAPSDATFSDDANDAFDFIDLTVPLDFTTLLQLDIDDDTTNCEIVVLEPEELSNVNDIDLYREIDEHMNIYNNGEIEEVDNEGIPIVTLID